MSSFLTQLNIKAAIDAKIPAITQTITFKNTIQSLITRMYRNRDRERTREIVDEGDFDGAAHDSVDPKPPTGSKYGSRHTGSKDCPQLR